MKKTLLSCLVVGGLMVSAASAQILKITYDRTQGTSSFDGTETSIHIHSGAGVSGGPAFTHVTGAWGDPASPGAMTQVGNLWEINIDLASYYPSPAAGSNITSIGMVFRESGPCGGFGGTSGNCKEGKDVNNQDIIMNISGTTITVTNQAGTPFAGVTGSFVTSAANGQNTNFNLNTFPNPFNQTANIGFNLNNSENVSVIVYNTIGQPVKVLNNSRLNAGANILTWDGTNGQNQAVANGVYFVRIVAGAKSETRQLMLVK